ncbi:MAG: hypothetical protein LBP72_05875 [Dysgonamonadaceae bacterium]|jgi:hypothetical protein|nr:hypothetical protein [Dysgonamonadaceae bacterium]
MKKKILVLLSVALALSANLRAQVTIGGLNAPKAGAILDLNSDAKGGLVLSNVGIDNPAAIPTGFPGVTPENTDAARAGLKGALVYNTNENTCIGIHAWNGNYWERIASSRKSTGDPLYISSSTTNAIGGDNIEFTVNTSAKTYAWYINKNGAGYEYFGVTTEPKLLAAIPAGTIKLKVITDNCHVLEESNEVTLQPESLSPNFGSVVGGNTIYIYGDFPYVSTEDYVQDGLVVHYDGINNTGGGDKYHSTTATTWKNLAGSGDATVNGTGATWTSNGITLTETSYVQTPYKPSDNTPFTFEAVTQLNPIGQIYMFLVTTSTYDPLRYGSAFPVEIDNRINVTQRNNNCNCTIYPNSPYADGSIIVSVLSNSVSGNIKYHSNGVLVYDDVNLPGTVTHSNNIRLNGTNDGSYMGMSVPYRSLRVYNRELTSAEIAQNAAVDQIRYLAPPTVTVGGIPCTEVAVLSPNFLMCKVPASTTGLGRKNVEITIGGSTLTLDGAYEYVDPINAFYVSHIAPIIGSQGDELTLTGNKFEEIVEVKVGDTICSTIIDHTGADGTDTCKFTLPVLTGEVDITIRTSSKTYRFAKVFEYK